MLWTKEITEAIEKELNRDYYIIYPDALNFQYCSGNDVRVTLSINMDGDKTINSILMFEPYYMKISGYLKERVKELIRPLREARDV